MSLRTLNPAAKDKWAEHKDWGNCTGCPLHKNRFKPVLARGFLPADVLFIGEAPGESENISGEPFDPGAPAGSELESLWEQSCSSAGIALVQNNPTRCITNIVACFPQKTPAGDFREPTKEEAKACAQRLAELIGICKPKLIVTLGNVAKRFLPLCPHSPPASSRGTASLSVTPSPRVVKLLHLVHPSAIVRTESNNSGDADLMRKRFVLALAKALTSLHS